MFDRFVPVSIKTVLDGPIYTTTVLIYGIFVKSICTLNFISLF